MINFDLEVNVNIPRDDFYLQWEHIYWWQLKFNIEVLIRDVNEKMLGTC